MKNANEIFKENLNYYIDLSGKKKKVIIEFANISHSSLSSYCNKGVIPRMPVVEKIAECLDVTKADLLEDRSRNNRYRNRAECEEIVNELYNNEDLRMLFHFARNLNDYELRLLRQIAKQFLE